MKLIGLKADGFRLLKAVEIKFNSDGTTVILGDNEQGKTSVLDVIEYLFRGKTTINEEIIQHGKDKMTAEIDLDDYVVKRIKTLKTDRLEIINKEGFKFAQKPQAFLDQLINDLTFDPFPFLNKTGDQKLRFMMDFLSLDTGKIDEEIKSLEMDRLICGREGKALGEVAKVEETQPIDINALISQKEQIEKENDEVVKKARIERDAKVTKAHEFNAVQRQRSHDIASMKADIENKESNLAVLYQELEELKQHIITTKATKDALIEKQKNLPVPKPEKETNLPLPLIDLMATEPLKLQIQKAEETNLQAFEYQEYLKKKKALEEKRSEYSTFTDKLTELKTSKKDILQKADTGVSGLEVREDGLYYDGIYSENWSDSQGIRLSAALCLSMNPKLRAVFIDRGESFGQKRFTELKKWAKENDMQAIITKVVDEKPQDIPEGTYYIQAGEIQKEK